MTEDNYSNESDSRRPSYGGAFSMTILAAALPLPDADASEPMEPESRYVVPHTMSSTLSGLLTFEQVQEAQSYMPRTALGRKLLALRQRAISGGMELWDEDRVAEEVQVRRKEG